MAHTVYLSLGANIGNREANMRRAIQKIGEQIGTVVRQSAFYETEPWGFASPNRFLNAAVCVETPLCPRCVLERTQAIERQLGRTRKTSPLTSHSSPLTSHPSPLTPHPSLPEYHDRPIDIDILLYDDLHVDEPDLKIPHPLMQEREFVMRPLREIFNRKNGALPTLLHSPG